MIRNILLTSDLSDCSTAAFQTAALLQTAFGAQLHLLHVLDSREDESRQHDHLLDLWTTRFPNLRAEAAVIHVDDGIARAIAQYAGTIHADVIVIATHGHRGIRRLIAGSVTERLLHESSIPVIVVPAAIAPTQEGTKFQILVTTDLSVRSETAFAPAAEIYRALGSENASMTLLYVAENMVEATYNFPLGGSIDDIRAELEEKAESEIARLRDRFFGGTMVLTTVIRANGPVYSEVASFAESHSADLIIMSAQGHSAVEHTLFGSVAEKMVRLSPTRIMIIPPPMGKP